VKDTVYQYVCPVTGLPFYTGHSRHLSKRNAQHRKETGSLGKKLRSYDPPLIPAVVAVFDTRADAEECEILHMFLDHTWHAYGGLNYRIGDLPVDFKRQEQINSACMLRQLSDEEFQKKRAKGITAFNTLPETKAKASQRLKTLFQNETFRQQHSERCRERMLARWKNPEYRAAQSKRMKAMRNDPVLAAKINKINSERMYRMNSDPDFIAKRAEGNKRQWEKVAQ
jgi:predicted GIY-YIG superfamily endonuclease